MFISTATKTKDISQKEPKSLTFFHENVHIIMYFIMFSGDNYIVTW